MKCFLNKYFSKLNCDLEVVTWIFFISLSLNEIENCLFIIKCIAVKRIFSRDIILHVQKINFIVKVVLWSSDLKYLSNTKNFNLMKTYLTKFILSFFHKKSSFVIFNIIIVREFVNSVNNTEHCVVWTMFNIIKIILLDD